MARREKTAGRGRIRLPAWQVARALSKKLILPFALVGLMAIAGLGLGVLGVAALRLAPMPDHLREGTVRAARRVGVAAWRFVASADQKPGLHFTEEISTTLLDVRLDDFDVDAVLPETPLGRGAIVLVGPNRFLLAAYPGQFYLLEVVERSVKVSKLPLHIETNRAQMVEYAENEGIETLNPSWLRLNDALLFDEGHLLAVSFNHWDDVNKCATLRVVTTPVPENWFDRPSPEWRELFRTRPCLSLDLNSVHALAGMQAGGRMFETAKGTLLLSTGDFGRDGVESLEAYPQDPETDYGKIIEIDVATGESRHISQGHRNPQGLLIDDEGRIWSTEHGARGGDELNLIQEGEDYGWPTVTLGTDYTLRYWPPSNRQGHHQGFRPPVFAWLPAIAPSQLIQINEFDEHWAGDLLVAGLVSQSVFRVRLIGNRVVYVEPLRIGRRVRDLVEDESGLIWLWTDDGHLVRMAPRESRTPDLSELSSRARNEMARCLTCHTLDAGRSDPNRITLFGVVERPVASLEDALYSEALQASGGRWRPERLDRFLADPTATVPGTTMVAPGIEDPEIRAEIVEFLSKLEH